MKMKTHNGQKKFKFKAKKPDSQARYKEYFRIMNKFADETFAADRICDEGVALLYSVLFCLFFNAICIIFHSDYEEVFKNKKVNVLSPKESLEVLFMTLIIDAK